MIAVATTLAAKTAEGLSEAGRSAMGKLIQRVRGRLAADPDGAAALESARRQPEERQRMERLAAALSEVAARDPLVAADVARLCAAVRDGGVAAADGGVVNQVSGSVGESVVQARDVSGGITFGARPDPGAREAR
ncbi:hypothetical protein [Phytohabitans houttuyneae]|nr:hypothetical protein [Phytohabitans houttuyneae]